MYQYISKSIKYNNDINIIYSFEPDKNNINRLEIVYENDCSCGGSTVVYDVSGLLEAETTVESKEEKLNE